MKSFIVHMDQFFSSLSMIDNLGSVYSNFCEKVELKVLNNQFQTLEQFLLVTSNFILFFCKEII